MIRGDEAKLSKAERKGTGEEVAVSIDADDVTGPCRVDQGQFGWRLLAFRAGPNDDLTVQVQCHGIVGIVGRG